MNNELLKKLLSCVDFEKLLLEIALKEYVKPKLEALVASTDNKFDDAALQLALPALEDALRDLLAKLKE